MNRTSTLVVATHWAMVLLATLPAASGHAACHLLTTAHADLLVTFTPGASNQLGLGLYDHEANVRRRTNEVTLVGGAGRPLNPAPGNPFRRGRQQHLDSAANPECAITLLGHLRGWCASGGFGR